MPSRVVKLLGLVVVFALAVAADAPPPPAYPAGALPDRIVLSPGADPSVAMAVAYRTNAGQAATEAELAKSLDSPGFGVRAQKFSGTAQTVAGGAIYHHVAFTGLKPDTAYVYRVKGSGGFSEWFSFRTAAAGFKPFRFVYFGDDQHDILAAGSRVIRQAMLTGPALALHAGDLINSHDAVTIDAEWGEWTASGGFVYAMVPEVPAIGNHEYIGAKPGPLFGATFALPGNGPDPVKDTAYSFVYQGVRFIILDGTAALAGPGLQPQADWLQKVLKANTARWTVAMMHQPMFMCSRQNDLPSFQAVWKPLFDKYGVDLVLQGHDHCYARWSNPASKVKAAKALKEPVYVISVSGGKMYAINDKTRAKADRIADDTQLYQVIDVEAGKLRLRAFTASGVLYDDFSIVGTGKTKRLVVAPNLPARRECHGDTGPDGLSCIAKMK
jgi:hypothetical protein